MKLLFTIFLTSIISLNSNNLLCQDKVIFKDEKGNQILLSDLEGVTGTYQWELKDDKKKPKRAIKLHQEARVHGGKREYDIAIEKLESAHEIAPNWAYPVYDLAYTYLLKEDFANALKYYSLTNEIEPRGFFTAKTAFWSLNNEAEGNFKKGLYLAFMQIEWMESDEEKIQIANAIVDRYPNYAPAWKIIASKASNENIRLKAIEKGLAVNPDLETKGTLLINKALVFSNQGKVEEAKKILGNLILNEESTLSNIEMAKFVLSTLPIKNY